MHSVAHLRLCVLVRRHHERAGRALPRHPAAVHAVPAALRGGVHHVMVLAVVHRRVVHVGMVPHVGVLHGCCNNLWTLLGSFPTLIVLQLIH